MNFIVGRCTASAMASASRKSFFWPFERGPNVSRRHQPRIVAKLLEPAAEMMRADVGFHANQTWQHIRKPRFYLAARPLLPQHDRTALIETNDVERVLADLDADEGILESFCHGVLLVFGAPYKHRL